MGELGETVHAEAPPNLAIQVIVDKLNQVETETLSTVMMLKKELEAMHCTNFSNYKSMFANHTSSLFLDSLGDQATSLFRSMKKFAEGMAQKEGIASTRRFLTMSCKRMKLQKSRRKATEMR